MEEKVINVEEVKEAVVEEKKKGKISKKVLAFGAGALALVGLGVILLTKGNKDGDTNQNQIVDTPYEPVSNNDSEVIE